MTEDLDLKPGNATPNAFRLNTDQPLNSTLHNFPIHPYESDSFPLGSHPIPEKFNGKVRRARNFETNQYMALYVAAYVVTWKCGISMDNMNDTSSKVIQTIARFHLATTTCDVSSRIRSS